MLIEALLEGIRDTELRWSAKYKSIAGGWGGPGQGWLCRIQQRYNTPHTHTHLLNHNHLPPPTHQCQNQSLAECNCAGLALVPLIHLPKEIHPV